MIPFIFRVQNKQIYGSGERECVGDENVLELNVDDDCGYANIQSKP